MLLPKGAVLLGATVGQIEIRGGDVHAPVSLTAEGQRQLSAGLISSSGETSIGLVYLLLENIRGTRDALVLQVSLSLPEGESSDDDPKLLAGSVGLYGLRMASASGEKNEGQGLSFVLEITRVVIELLAVRTTPVTELRVTIVPQRQRAASSDIVVGRVSVFASPQ